MNILISTLNSKFIHTSLSIRYLKSYLDETPLDVNIEEYTINQNNDFITGDIFKKNPDVLAFSCYIWNIEDILDISKRLKLVNQNIKIVLGGPEVSYDGENILRENPFVDFIIYGEGEQTFKELMTKLDSKDQNFNNINGLIFRKENEIVKTYPRKQLNDLDLIPTPFKSDFKEYENKIVYYESSRGCPFNCEFCLSSTVKGIRYFSLERVKSDIKKLIEAKVKQVKFVDRTFNANKNYAMEIMNFIMDQDVVDTNFHFEVTAHLIDDEMLEFLKDAKEGLFQFEIGVQSTNDETLNEINRKTDFIRLSEVVNKIKSYNNIHQHLDLIAGLPYEGYESFRKSFNDVYSLNPDKLQLGFLKLLKGSGLRLNKEKHGYKFIDRPTYEVLENDYINYNEMLKLKLIEEVVERYGNENDFKASTTFIINNYFETAFDFFEDLAIYFEENSYDKVSHSKKGLYKILLEYYYNRLNKNSTFNELIKFDFIFNNKSKLPDFINSLDTNELIVKRHDFLKNEDNIKKYLPKYKDLSSKQIIKKVHFEEFSVDVLKFSKYSYNLNKLEKCSYKTILLFEYKYDKLSLDNSSVYDVTDKFIDMEG